MSQGMGHFDASIRGAKTQNKDAEKSQNARDKDDLSSLRKLGPFKDQ
jgi:hypothetical protein